MVYVIPFEKFTKVKVFKMGTPITYNHPGNSKSRKYVTLDKLAHNGMVIGPCGNGLYPL